MNTGICLKSKIGTKKIDEDYDFRENGQKSSIDKNTRILHYSDTSNSTFHHRRGLQL